ncbi:MAG: hypothetical protein RR135_03535 [Oscillospiraceae bacterium]
MRLVSLGFVFLLLPVSAALYYCLPNRFKAAALILISALILLLMEPHSTPWLLCNLAADCGGATLLSHRSGRPRRLWYRAFFTKNVLILGVWGVLLPLLTHKVTSVGVIVLPLTMLCLMTSQMRGKQILATPMAVGAGALFFGRLSYGPVSLSDAILTRVEHPAPSLTLLGHGVMRFTLGVAKRVILAEQTLALFKTLARLPIEQISTVSAWMAAMCAALGVYYTLSAYSDMAVGLGQMFSLELPHMTYYPFQAPNVRDYLYRLNMPLEDAVGGLLFDHFDRERGDWRAYLVSGLMPIVLSVWLFPTMGGMLWGLWLAGLVLLDFAVLRRIPLRWSFLSRVLTFVITLPAYILLLPNDMAHRWAALRALVPFSGVLLANNTIVYLTTSNLVLLLLAIIACTSAINTLGRLTARQFPNLWWVCSFFFHGLVLVATSSFLLWNVR